MNIPPVTGHFLDRSFSVEDPAFSPHRRGQASLKSATRPRGTCENILETGSRERKTCSETPGQPTAVHPRESTLVSTLCCSFLRRPVPARPGYFCKPHVTEVPAAAGPQGAASQPFLSLVTAVRSSSAERVRKGPLWTLSHSFT